MRKISYSEAIDLAIGQAMAEDECIIMFGEDVPAMHAGLVSRFGSKRIMGTPISEGAFVGAAVGAAMAGLRPIVEVMLVDFIGVAMDAIFNHAAKVRSFSGDKWTVPMVIRTACGGGYGDGGQHEQSLWGWLGHIPGLKVVVPSTPEDAAGLMLSAIRDDDPVVFMEHKLLSDSWLDFMGYGGRKTVSFDVPPEGRIADMFEPFRPIGMGKGIVRREGSDVSIISIGVSVHRAIESAEMLAERKFDCEVIDLRTVWPPDKYMIIESVKKTGNLLVVDEDYENFGLSAEIAAIALEAGLSFRFKRVCTNSTIPYDRQREYKILPNNVRIMNAVSDLLR